MALWLRLDGVKPYDGRYELDLDGQPLTRREWGWIKRNAGVPSAHADSGDVLRPGGRHDARDHRDAPRRPCHDR